jgi:hypothetical protein
MGFLRHDTNDVILDAVLTDKGRELLAAQDGSFQIARFALSDEDVDYNIIHEFGRVVGKEKIEKNTPVLEALTTTSLSQKNSLISISSNNSTLSYLPISAVSATSGGTMSGNVLSLDITNGAPADNSTIKIVQSIDTAVLVIPQDVVNHSYTVELSNLFLNISEQNYDNVTSNNVATYTLPATSTDSSDFTSMSTLEINLVANSINTDSYSMYIKNDVIRTFVTIMGNQDGSETTFEVQIATA